MLKVEGHQKVTDEFYKVFGDGIDWSLCGEDPSIGRPMKDWQISRGQPSFFFF